MAIITNLRRWRNGEVINARDYVYERDLIVSLVNQHELDLTRRLQASAEPPLNPLNNELWFDI